MTTILRELNFTGGRKLPVLQASEAAECGLACVAMVAAYHGHDVDLNGLRQRYPLSMSGATLRGVISLADGLGLTSRALKVEMEDLAQLALPAILHWDLNHFVVLKSVSARGVVIHDPNRGERRLTLVDTSQHFTGVALELRPIATFKKVSARIPVNLSSLWSSSEGFWAAFFQIIALSVGLQVVAFAMPFQMQLVIDEAVLRGDADLLTVLALGFGFLVVIQALIEAVRAWALQLFGQMLSFQMVGNVVRHLIRLPTDWFEKRHVGDVMSRIGSTAAIQDVLTHGVVAAVIDGVMALVAVVILLLYSPLLTVVVLASVALNLGISFALLPALTRRTEDQITLAAREQTHLMETVRAARTIKMLGREAEREATWRNLFANVVNAKIGISRLQISIGFVQTLLTGVQTVVIIYLGARAILAGDGFSIGMLYAYMSFRQTFTDRCTNLINQLLQFQFVRLHLDRLGDIVTAESEPSHEDSSGLRLSGSISLTDVTFRYGATDRPVLSNIDLNIADGEFVAITGPSGGGKTTLLKILLGLSQPTSGRVELGGQAAAPELWRAWRRKVGLVAQDDQLLSGSIADNIAFFDPATSMVDVEQAAMAAQIHQDILGMPMQYQTLVGDMGAALSGGQRQRLLLARALYRKPSVLVLDEGTANLDLANEALIADLVAALPITRIVVAHRPALLERADRVVSILGGRIVHDSDRQSHDVSPFIVLQPAV